MLSKAVYYLFVFSMVVPFQMLMFTLSSTADRLDLDTPYRICIIYLGFGAGLAVLKFVNPLNVSAVGSLNTVVVEIARSILSEFIKIMKIGYIQATEIMPITTERMIFPVVCFSFIMPVPPLILLL